MRASNDALRSYIFCTSERRHGVVDMPSELADRRNPATGVGVGASIHRGQFS